MLHQFVAGLGGQLPHAGAFGTQHQRHRAAQIGLVQRAAGASLVPMIRMLRSLSSFSVRARLVTMK
jgi:hypothetical protein